MTGKYRERGNSGLDGYQTEFVVDREQYIVQVPPELEPVGILLEPLSVVEKAIDEACVCRLFAVQTQPQFPTGCMGGAAW